MNKKFRQSVYEAISRAVKQSQLFNDSDKKSDKIELPTYDAKILERKLQKYFDIENVPYVDRLKQYNVDYQEIYDFLKNGYNDVSHKIDENVIIQVADVKYSNTYEDVENILTNSYELKDWQIKRVNDYGVENIKVDSPKYAPEKFVSIVSGKYKTNMEYISRQMANCGYYCFHYYEKTDKDGLKWFIMLFNPRFPEEVNDYMKDEIDMLYHASPLSNHNDIVKYGFVPSERYDENLYEGVYTPSRVFYKMGRAGWRGYLAMLKRVADRNIKKNPSRKFNVYRISIEKVVDKYSFRRDPNCKESCYTEETIPYDGFEVYDTIEL